MNIAKRILVGLVALCTAGYLPAEGGPNSRRGYEEPEYEVVETIAERLEIRSYGERLIAEARVPIDGRRSADNGAFRLLFKYITGNNVPNEEVAMTVPVEMETERTPPVRGEEIAMTVPVEMETVEMDTVEEERVMRFFFPAGYTAETAPRPADPRVSITTMPAETVAALRFSGRTYEAKVAEKKAELLTALETSTWRAVEEPLLWGFDDPFTLPFLRRNEVVVRVEPRETAAESVEDTETKVADAANAGQDIPG